MDRIILITHSEKETKEIGRKLGEILPPNSIVCLFGELGAGKTTLIKGLASQASGTPAEQIQSPTFVYLNIYKGPKTVYHFDLYRLQTEDEFLSMGFEDFFYSGGICCLEWSERIESLLPQSCVKVFIEHMSEGARKITIVNPGTHLNL